MSDLRWIAAVLAPRDVAPHLNFTSREAITPPALLALLVQAQTAEYQRIVDQDRFMPEGIDSGIEVIPERGSGIELVSLTLEALQLSTTASATERLRDFLASGSITESGCLTAGVLLCSVLLSEQDRHDDALETIDYGLKQIRRDEGEDALLLSAALHQQAARRRFDIGESGLHDAKLASTLLAQIRPRKLSTFKLSVSASWDSRDTLNNIIELLQYCSNDHVLRIETAFGDSRRLDTVRTATPVLLLRSVARAETGFSRYVSELFESQFSSTQRFGSSNEADFRLYSALVYSELCGAPDVTERRRELGLFRYLSTQGEDPPQLRADALRLLRQSGNLNQLRPAIRNTRQNGPLVALREETERVVRRRSTRGRLRRAELAVIEGGGDLLETEEAQAAYSALLSATQEQPDYHGGEWQSESILLERIWKAIAAVAGPAALIDVANRAMLAHIQGIVELLGTEEADEVLDRAYARILASWDWDHVTEETRLSWTALLRQPQRVFPHTNRAVADRILVDAAAEAPVNDPTLNQVAAAVNRTMATREPFPSGLREVARSEAVKGMTRIRESAASSRFGRGGLPVADIALALAMYAGLDDLFDLVSDFLTDPRVSRTDKSEALDRIALSPSGIPEKMVRVLSVRKDSILDLSPDFFEDDVSPYPAGLRALAALRVLDDASLVRYLSLMAADRKPAARLEAARTLTVLTGREEPPSWVFALCMQLSSDDEPGARAEAGRALARMARAVPEYRDIIVERMSAMLGEDGILPPTLILRALAHEDELASEVRDTIAELSVRHPSYTVRSAALQVLGD